MWWFISTMLFTVGSTFRVITSDCCARSLILSWLSNIDMMSHKWIAFSNIFVFVLFGIACAQNCHLNPDLKFEQHKHGIEHEQNEIMMWAFNITNTLSLLCLERQHISSSPFCFALLSVLFFLSFHWKFIVQCVKNRNETEPKHYTSTAQFNRSDWSVYKEFSAYLFESLAIVWMQFLVYIYLQRISHSRTSLDSQSFQPRSPKMVKIFWTPDYLCEWSVTRFIFLLFSNWTDHHFLNCFHFPKCFCKIDHEFTWILFYKFFFVCNMRKNDNS